MDERDTVSRFEHDKEMMHLNWCNRRMLIALVVSMLAMIIAIVTFVNGYNECDFDYGFECYMPQNIDIDGLYVDDRAAADADNYRGVALLHNITPQNKDDSFVPAYPYHVTKNLRIRNFSSASGKKWFLSTNTYMYRNLNLVEE